HPVGDTGGVHAPLGAELAQDVRDVHARGAGADVESGGDLAVGVALGEQPEHRELARGQVGAGLGSGGDPSANPRSPADPYTTPVSTSRPITISTPAVSTLPHRSSHSPRTW